MTTRLDIEATEVDVPAVDAVTIEARCRVADIGTTVPTLFSRLGEFVGRTALRVSGAPRIIYTEMDEGDTTLVAAMPVAAGASSHDGNADIRVRVLPAGRMWRFVHHGPYPNMGTTYDAITEWLRQKQLITDERDWIDFMPMWEEYVNDPATTKPEDLLTHIYLPRP